MSLQEIKSILLNSKDLVLVTHENPDIDSLSSMLALFLSFPEKKILPLVEKIPQYARFLYGIEKLIEIDKVKEELTPELLVVLDVQCEKRIPEKIRNILRPKKVLILDHHQKEDCERFLGLTPFLYINSEEPSTSLLLFRLLKYLEIVITPEIAENLLAGLYYDTGSFRYENVKGDIFAKAQELIDLGADPSRIAQALYENTPLETVYALRIALQRLEFLKDKTVAFTYLSLEDLKFIGPSSKLNDIANFLRSIEGVKLAVFLREVEKGIFKVSLRSKAPVIALPLAQQFGGGGHKYACGFSLKTNSLEEAIFRLRKALEEFF